MPRSTFRFSPFIFSQICGDDVETEAFVFGIKNVAVVGEPIKQRRDDLGAPYTASHSLKLWLIVMMTPAR